MYKRCGVIIIYVLYFYCWDGNGGERYLSRSFSKNPNSSRSIELPFESKIWSAVVLGRIFWSAEVNALFVINSFSSCGGCGEGVSVIDVGGVWHLLAGELDMLLPSSCMSWRWPATHVQVNITSQRHPLIGFGARIERILAVFSRFISGSAENLPLAMAQVHLTWDWFVFRKSRQWLHWLICLPLFTMETSGRSWWLHFFTRWPRIQEALYFFLFSFID